jgi:uncharacterized protein (TIGR04141 family)
MLAKGDTPERRMEDKAPTIGLSLRLLRKGVTVAKALKEDHELHEVDSRIGRLFIGHNPPSPPSWVKFLGQISTEALTELKTQSCSAVLLLEAKNRRFALSFGQGHHALDEDAIQRGFGLRVVLNSVARGRLRTLDSASLDSTVMQRRAQASRDTDLSAFGIDQDRDILRLASGTPESNDFAKALTGKDALQLRAKIPADKLLDRCGRALDLFQATDYKKDFAFIDHVLPVQDTLLNAELDGITFAEIKTLVEGKPSDLHLAMPEILAPGSGFEIGYFGVGLRPGAKTAYVEVSIDDYIEELRKGNFAEIPDLPVLRGSHQIRVIEEGEGDKSHKQRLYNCLVYETVLRNNTYVLFDGEWYLVEKKFHAAVESAFNALLRPAFKPSTTALNEQKLIKELETEADLLSIDRTKVSPMGAPGANLEPCDFLSRDRQLIHLKDGHASAPLSHLWNQGLISAEAFMSDETFRKGFRKKVRLREKEFKKTGFVALLPPASKKPDANTYPVIFGVMRHPYKATKLLGLPFFSKVALRAVAERLARMNFNVELHLIAKQ